MGVGRVIAAGTVATAAATWAGMVTSTRAPVERDGRPRVGSIAPAGLALVGAGVGARMGASLLRTHGMAPRLAGLGGLVGVALIGAGAGVLGSTTTPGQFIAGATQSLVNTASTLVRTPIVAHGHRYWYQGPLTEPVGDAQRAGARAANEVLSWVGLVPHDGPGDEPHDGTLLTWRKLEVDPAQADQPWTVQFHADAPGADWGVAGREAAMLRIYVDGEHHSDVVVHAERDVPYRVNLGVLGAGRHDVQVRRPSPALVPEDRPVADLDGTIEFAPLQGDAAVIAEHAPIIEGRDLGMPGGMPSELSTDAPLVVVPQVEHDEQGRIRTITYRTMYSGEDGGTAPEAAIKVYGRSVDMELAYQVRFDALGRVVEELFGAPMHRIQRFDGQRIGNQPILRVATSNNNYSQQVRGSGTRWSLAPESPATVGIRTLAAELVRDTPWIEDVAEKELARQRG